MTFERRTIAREVLFEGLGLHTGEPVSVRIIPGENGILFRSPSDSWAATPANVTDTRRCTRLGEISTIEHLMSALCGLEITDVEIEVTGGELPALDGAAAEYCSVVGAAGHVSLGEATLRDPFARLFVQGDGAKAAVGAGNGHWRYDYVTGARWPGTQTFEIASLPEGYQDQIAPARTFGLEEEVPHLHALGLARGLDLSNALVLGTNGYVNEAKFPDEPARHKLLDMMGDLYLAGVPARCLNVVGERSGHTLHVELAAKLYEAVKG